MNKWIAVCGLALTVLTGAVGLRAASGNGVIMRPPTMPPTDVIMRPPTLPPAGVIMTPPQLPPGE